MTILYGSAAFQKCDCVHVDMLSTIIPLNACTCTLQHISTSTEDCEQLSDFGRQPTEMEANQMESNITSLTAECSALVSENNLS